MTDAYAHLDMTHADPLADLAERMGNSGIDSVLIVETWDGKNRGLLEGVRDQPTALCWRGEEAFPSTVYGARVKTSMLGSADALLTQLEEHHQCLLVHGDGPITSWTRTLDDIASARPALAVYVPHLGWPMFESQPNRGWADCLAALAKQKNVFLGVSAIAHFSRESFPHDDVKVPARIAMELFGADRIVAASDYPMFEKSRYGDYMRLAEEWIRDLWPDWSDNNALRA